MNLGVMASSAASRCDTLSRAPSRKPADADDKLQEEADAFVSIATNSLPATQRNV